MTLSTIVCLCSSVRLSCRWGWKAKGWPTTQKDALGPAQTTSSAGVCVYFMCGVCVWERERAKQDGWDQKGVTLYILCIHPLALVQLVRDIRRLVDNCEFLASRHCPSAVCQKIVTLLVELITDHSREVWSWTCMGYCMHTFFCFKELEVFSLHARSFICDHLQIVSPLEFTPDDACFSRHENH